MGLVFTLVEGGFADGEFGFFCGHCSISPKSFMPGLASSPASQLAPTGTA